MSSYPSDVIPGEFMQILINKDNERKEKERKEKETVLTQTTTKIHTMKSVTSKNVEQNFISKFARLNNAINTIKTEIKQITLDISTNIQELQSTISTISDDPQTFEEHEKTLSHNITIINTLINTLNKMV